MRAVVLITDFGLSDHYVGVLHAVIEREAPGTPQIDLVHDLPPGDIWAGCYQLRCAWPHLPPDAVILAVVDPGVGTGRRAVAVQVGERWLVAPDNGLAAAVGPAVRVIDLDAGAMGLAEPSPTFHGRDLFAPAAARLARGDAPDRLGRDGDIALVSCPLPEPRREEGGRVHGAVIHTDWFGNVITNIPASWVPGDAEVRCGWVRIRRRVRTYGEAPPGELVYLEGSSGLVEISVNGGSAAQLLAIRRGDPVVAVPGG